MIQVRWEKTVLDLLANLWLQANSELRKLITQATAQIDQILQTNPYQAGESRDQGRRILFVPPLGVIFRIEPHGQTVSVVDVWLINRK